MKKTILFILTTISVTPGVWSQRENYEVYAIKFAAKATPLPVSDLADKGSKNDSVNLDFMIWLIKGNNGKNVLVDAGFLNDVEEAKNFGIINYVRPDSMLSKLALTA